MNPEETDQTLLSLQKKLQIMEAMTEGVKWIGTLSDENKNLRKALGDHDLTRIQLMESEREREDLNSQVESLRERLDMWQESALQLAEVLLDLEKKGTKFTKAQQNSLANVMKESYKNAK